MANDPYKSVNQTEEFLKDDSGDPGGSERPSVPR